MLGKKMRGKGKENTSLALRGQNPLHHVQCTARIDFTVFIVIWVLSQFKINRIEFIEN